VADPGSSRPAISEGECFIGGFWLGVPGLMVLSVAYVAGLALFALATLPVELGASRPALALVRTVGLADAEDVDGIRRVLTAALTYVLALLGQVGLFALIVLAEAARRVAK
jgi:uncharacterized protein